MNRLATAHRLLPVGRTLTFLRYLDDFPFKPRSDVWDDTRQSGYGDSKVYVVQTAATVIERCMLMCTDPGDLVLDPTCGSGTTAFVAEQWGRRWITVDTSRVALALARQRIMGARFPYYLLADSVDGRRKEQDLAGKQLPAAEITNDIRHGFVYERVQHITLKSIANNPDIREGMSRAEIDAAIKRHAEYEVLYDKPYQDNSKVRVAGPFTVESLSPHRTLGVDEHDELIDPLQIKESGAQSFEQMILENLHAAGVQQAHREGRITFETLTPWPGEMVCAEGRYREGDVEKRAAIFIGPEFGTVQRPDLVKAAREAGDAGFDVLIACAFNYEAHASEFSKLGRIPVLKARMNADLHMGGDLKPTGKGNLFVVFGEPDIEILHEGDGRLMVHVKGVDVFDPAAGDVRSDGPDGIACWFIDTDYNEESFFVRHAYFLGQNDPYGALKTTLKAEIDADVWATLNSAVSRPFQMPKGGRIAVKVINHLGDEVMKVFRIE